MKQSAVTHSKAEWFLVYSPGWVTIATDSRTLSPNNSQRGVIPISSQFSPSSSWGSLIFLFLGGFPIIMSLENVQGVARWSSFYFQDNPYWAQPDLSWWLASIPDFYRSLVIQSSVDVGLTYLYIRDNVNNIAMDTPDRVLCVLFTYLNTK